MQAIGRLAEVNKVQPILVEALKRINGGRLEHLEMRPPAYLKRKAPYWGASSIGGCALALAYRSTGVHEAEGMDDYGRWVAGLGTLAHAAIQSIAHEYHLGVEVPFTLGEPWLIQSEADLDDSAGDEVIDIKTLSASQFGWNLVSNTTARFKDAIQVGVGMKALGRSNGRIAYAARDRVGDQYWAEIVFTMEEIEPALDHVLKGVAAIRTMIEDGEMPPRWIPGEMPSGARIVSAPSSPDGWGHWIKEVDDECYRGRTKVCSFCDYRSVCSQQLATNQKENQP